MRDFTANWDMSTQKLFIFLSSHDADNICTNTARRSWTMKMNYAKFLFLLKNKFFQRFCEWRSAFDLRWTCAIIVIDAALDESQGNYWRWLNYRMNV